MSDNLFDSVLKSLHKHPDKDRLLKMLCVVRKEVDWPQDKDNIMKLHESGCLKPIVDSLLIPNKNHIGVALSILGNCCMEPTSARDIVRKYNTLPNLLLLLTTYPKHDSINGRVFRIIGNICQHMDRLADTVMQRAPKIVDGIVNYLKGSTSEASESTIIMGIRAFRVLLNCNTVLLLVENHQVLNSLGMLLMEYTLKYRNGEKHDYILSYILKTLHEYSRYKCLGSLEQLNKTDTGNSLVHLTELIPLSPKRVVKIIMNFIKISHHKSDLPLPEICDSLIDYLKKLDHNCDPSLFKEYLQCFCVLFEYPANREVIRQKNGVPLLIDILRKFKTPTEFTLKFSTLIFATLVKCMYDEALVAAQLKCGIVDALIEKLEWLAGTSKCLEFKHMPRKRYQPIIESLIPEKKLKIILGIGMSVDGSLYPRSPSPCDSDQEMSLPTSPRTSYPSPSESFISDIVKMSRSESPSSNSDISYLECGSPSSSRCGNQNSLGDNSEWDSDDYSPVCSEIDEEEQISTEVVDEMMFVEEDDCVKNDEGTSLLWLKDAMCSEALSVLRWLTKLKPTVRELCNSNLLITLLRYSKPFNNLENLKAIDIISDILSCREHMMAFLQTDLIAMAADLTEISHNDGCVTCQHLKVLGNFVHEKMRCTADTAPGRGDIKHFFIRADLQIKQKLLLVIPYVVRHSFLSGIMIQHGGLSILTNLLSENAESLRRTVAVLHKLSAKRLRFQTPEILTSSPTRNISLKPYEMEKASPNVVTFKLDDGTLLKADREFLCEKSEYFERLLNGEFKESKEDTIVLRNVANKSLTLLFSLLRCTIKRTEIVEIDLDLTTLLDLILLTDRYLLVDLCVVLTSCVEQFWISTKTVADIYGWSLDSKTNILRVEAVGWALGAKILDSERTVVFKEIMDSGYSQEFTEDIHNLLERLLSMDLETAYKEKMCIS